MLKSGWSSAVSIAPMAVQRKAPLPPEILAKQINLAFSGLRSASIANLLLATALAIGVAPFVDWVLIGGWYLLLMAALTVRLIIRHRFQKASPEDSSDLKWRTGLVMSSMLLGSTWGFAGVIFFVDDNLPLQALLAFTFGGFGAGSLVLSAAYLPMAAAVILPLFVPLAIRFAMEGDQLHLLMGGMIALFVVTLAALARKLNSSLTAEFTTQEKLTATAGDLQREAVIREREQKLLELISYLQSEFISSEEWNDVFKVMLNRILAFTESEYGFIGEVLRDSQDEPYLKTYAITNIAWDDATRRLYDENASTGMEFRNLSTLFGAALQTGRPVFTNNPSDDPRRGGLPAGHPPLEQFLALPLYRGGKFVGLLGLANRQAGYDEAYVAFLRPLALTCGNIIHAMRSDLQRRLTLTALADSEALKSGILATSLDAVVTMDQLGNIIEFNGAAEQMFGYSAVFAKGRSVAELLVPERLRKAHGDGLERFHRTGEGPVLNKRVEVIAMRANGDEFPAELAVVPIVTESGLVFSSYIRDISDRIESEVVLRRAKDEAESSSLAKSEFLAIMSHEIRTPMNGLLGMLELLLDSNLDERQRRFVMTAIESGAGLQTLLNDMLDLTRIEAGKLMLDDVSFDLRQVVQGTVELFAREAERKGVLLQGSISKSIPSTVRGDPGRLRQIMNNLLSNAVKFTDHGEIHVIVTETGREDGRVVLRFEVSDTGMGIPEDFQKRLFEDFAQADHESVRRHSGAGLGLGIVRRLIELMGGTIEFETASGAGSRFWFDLELQLGDVDKSARLSGEDVNRPSRSGEFAGMAFLVVDDSAVNRLVVKEHLAKSGARIVEAASGEEAVSLAGQERFDLILMDIAMPVMDGLEAHRLIRNSDGPNRETPTIAVTAYVSPADQKRFRADAMAGFLGKPILRSALFQSIQRALGSANDVEPVGASSDLLDKSIVTQMRRDVGVAVQEKLIRSFLSEAETRISDMAGAVRHHDLERLSLEAHALKGMAGTFGAAILADLCGTLENAGRAGDLDTALKHIGGLADLLHRSVEQLRANVVTPLDYTI